MSYTLALRLPGPLFKQIRLSAKNKKKSRSEIIREALESYFQQNGVGGEKDAYQALMSLMPLEKSGVTDLAKNSKTCLRKKIHARAATH